MGEAASSAMTGGHDIYGGIMAAKQTGNEGAQVDFKSHARDYSLMIAMLKWGAIAALLIGLFVLIIISN